jgi:hypothetical protein
MLAKRVVHPAERGESSAAEAACCVGIVSWDSLLAYKPICAGKGIIQPTILEKTMLRFADTK